MRAFALAMILGLVLAPALAAPPAAATTCILFGDDITPEGLVSGARCIVRAEVCLFTNAIRPGWCPV